MDRHWVAIQCEVSRVSEATCIITEHYVTRDNTEQIRDPFPVLSNNDYPICNNVKFVHI